MIWYIRNPDNGLALEYDGDPLVFSKTLKDTCPEPVEGSVRRIIGCGCAARIGIRKAVMGEIKKPRA